MKGSSIISPLYSKQQMDKNKDNLSEKTFSLVRPLWMLIRKLSPKGAYIKLGDYWVKDPSLAKIDRLFPRTRQKIDVENYEENSIAALRRFVSQGDRVTIVGGGYGITGIVAMEKGGQVTLIEASKERAKDILKTWEKYKLKGTVIHGYVGSPVNVWGEMEGADKIEEIPDCDILELDCEGGEKEVLANLSIQPRVIIVESHGDLGSPTSLVKELLERKGYEIIEEKDEEPSRDIMVLVAKRK
ncbi:MAG: FkbM family methyltransferase [Ignavibacteria bacterium]|jgi:hypothetical protein|nr:FkbM family methyltransferase [Ignavibacteria bacterium]